MPILPAGHDYRFAITLNLAALSVTAQSFNVGFFDKDETVDASGFLEFTDVATATTAEAAGNISTIALAFVTAAFAQTPKRPQKVVVMPWDDAGGDAIATAIDDAIAAEADFYVFGVSDRLPATNAAVAAKLDTLAGSGTKLVAILQDDDGDWLTSGKPTAYASLTTGQNERTAVVYCDTDATTAAEAVAAKKLCESPDVRSAPWTGPVQGSVANASSPTTAEIQLAVANNCNVIAPQGTIYTQVNDPGVNLAGRHLKQIVSADWYEVRLREALADAKTTLENKGRYIPVNTDGLEVIKGIITEVWLRGVDAGHFARVQPANPELSGLTIDDAASSANATTRTITVEFEIYELESLLGTTITVNLTV